VSQLLSAIETLAEHACIRHATVAIRVEHRDDVDLIYADLGVPTKGRCEAPHDDYTSDGLALERKAVTEVQGVRVIITGPFQLATGRRAA
jgi:hypothetical protein